MHEASSGKTPAFLNVFKGIAERLNLFFPCDLAIPGRVMTRKNQTKFAWAGINYEKAGWQMLWLHKQKLRWMKTSERGQLTASGKHRLNFLSGKSN
jgi:hypothetical protein